MAMNYSFKQSAPGFKGVDEREKRLVPLTGPLGGVQGGGAFGAVTNQALNDPMSALAERIGVLQGLLTGPTRSNFPFSDPSNMYQSQLAPLQALMQLYAQKQQNELDMQKEQFRQYHRNSQRGSSGGIEFNGNDLNNGPGFGGMPGGQPQTGGPYYVVDPYADVRAAAKEAAKRYLGAKRPAR